MANSACHSTMCHGTCHQFPFVPFGDKPKPYNWFSGFVLLFMLFWKHTLKATYLAIITLINTRKMYNKLYITTFIMYNNIILGLENVHFLKLSAKINWTSAVLKVAAFLCLSELHVLMKRQFLNSHKSVTLSLCPNSSGRLNTLYFMHWFHPIHHYQIHYQMMIHYHWLQKQIFSVK